MAEADNKSSLPDKEWRQELKERVEELGDNGWKFEVERSDEPTWRKDQLEEDPESKAVNIRVYCIYETRSPEGPPDHPDPTKMFGNFKSAEQPAKPERILGNYGMVDPTLYIAGGIVDLEYHSCMTFSMLWRQFQEHIFQNVVPTEGDDLDVIIKNNDTPPKETTVGAQLYNMFATALSRDSTLQALNWVEITQTTGTTLAAGNNVCPGFIPNLDAVSRNIFESASCSAGSSSEDVIIDNFTSIEDDDAENKCIALMRCDHCMVNKEGKEGESWHVYNPVYRMKKPKGKYLDWLNLIMRPCEMGSNFTEKFSIHKGKWEEQVLKKAGNIVGQKKKGSSGKQGSI